MNLIISDSPLLLPSGQYSAGNKLLPEPLALNGFPFPRHSHYVLQQYSLSYRWWTDDELSLYMCDPPWLYQVPLGQFSHSLYPEQRWLHPVAVSWGL